MGKRKIPGSDEVEEEEGEEEGSEDGFSVGNSSPTLSRKFALMYPEVITKARDTEDGKKVCVLSNKTYTELTCVVFRNTL